MVVLAGAVVFVVLAGVGEVVGEAVGMVVLAGAVVFVVLAGVGGVVGDVVGMVVLAGAVVFVVLAGVGEVVGEAVGMVVLAGAAVGAAVGVSSGAAHVSASASHVSGHATFILAPSAPLRRLQSFLRYAAGSLRLPAFFASRLHERPSLFARHFLSSRQRTQEPHRGHLSAYFFFAHFCVDALAQNPFLAGLHSLAGSGVGRGVGRGVGTASGTQRPQAAGHAFLALILTPRSLPFLLHFFFFDVRSAHLSLLAPLPSLNDVESGPEHGGSAAATPTAARRRMTLFIVCGGARGVWRCEGCVAVRERLLCGVRGTPCEFPKVFEL